MTQHVDLSRRSILTAAAVVPVFAVPAGATMAQSGDDARRRLPAEGKAALVTGSSRGIGAATARRLARDGYAVTVNCVASTGLAAGVVRDIEREGSRAIWVQADVSDPVAVRDLFDAHMAAFGRLDVAVSNAGIMRLAPIREMSDADFIRMTDVNQKGSFFVLREAARRIEDGGRIIALSSSITRLRTATYGPYAASKGAQDYFVSALAKELEGRRVSVNAVAPGLVNTTLFTDGKTPEQIAGFAARTPYKRLGEPADIAGVIAKLCTDEGGWVNGQTVFANGGFV